jgi:hypothetical protein
MVRSLEPLLPLVTTQYATSRPSLTNFATVPPAPNSESSGCAVITITRSILSAIDAQSPSDFVLRRHDPA